VDGEPAVALACLSAGGQDFPSEVPGQHVGLAGPDLRQVSGRETTPTLAIHLAAHRVASDTPLKWRRNMSMTRRIFMAGLAAVLSVIRIPGVSASKKVIIGENVYEESDFDPYIEYLEVGERGEMLGGPATEAGWYLHPDCMIGCCKSKGPFPSKEDALEANRISWIETREAMKRWKAPANDDIPLVY
jgi:hypothetical protein